MDRNNVNNSAANEEKKTVESSQSAPAESEAGSGLTPIKDVLLSTCDRLKRQAGGGGGLAGISTGFEVLDEITSGFAPSQLIVLAARPGMGKSTLALNIALAVGKTTNKSVALFNLEMTKDQMCRRLISNEGEVEFKNMVKSLLGEDDWEKIDNAVEVLSTTKLCLDDDSMSTVASIKKKCEKLDNLGLIVIDYLQLMQPDKSDTHKNENRQQAVASISRSLKLLAKELNVPVLCLSQLSRDNEKRQDKRPLLSDLRDSGAIEQDADIVMLLHREGYYNQKADDLYTVECNIAKNREGETKTVLLRWEPQYARFRDEIEGLPFPDEEDEEPNQPDEAVQTELQAFQNDSTDKSPT